MDGCASINFTSFHLYILSFQVENSIFFVSDSPFPSSVLFIHSSPFPFPLPTIINFHFFPKEQQNGKGEIKEKEKKK